MEQINFYSELQRQILAALGVEQLSVQHCRMLSIAIFEKDRNYVSEATIKRFFGFLTLSGSFNPFVLNSLSQFLGYECWENLKDKVAGQVQVRG